MSACFADRRRGRPSFSVIAEAFSRGGKDAGTEEAINALLVSEEIEDEVRRRRTIRIGGEDENDYDTSDPRKLPSCAGQHACFHLFLDRRDIFRKTIAEHRGDNGFAPSIACYKASFFSAPFNICQ